MKNLIFFVLLLVISSLTLTSCGKEEVMEDVSLTEIEEVITVEIPRGISEDEATEWAESLTYEDALSLAVDSPVMTSRACYGWSSWRTYSSYSSCSGCSGYAKARHTLHQKRSRVCCNSVHCYVQLDYRTRYACRTYC